MSRSCPTTRPCLSRAEALARAALLNRGRRRVKGAYEAGAYACSACGWWHIAQG